MIKIHCDCGKHLMTLKKLYKPGDKVMVDNIEWTDKEFVKGSIMTSCPECGAMAINIIKKMGNL